MGNPSGVVLAELAPSLGPVSWRLSDIGQAQFSLAQTDPKAVEANLRFGNRVLIQFDNGLPDWGGVIEPPRSWRGGDIGCTAYSAEYIFGTRTSSKNREFAGATVGQIFQELIEDADGQHPLDISLGTIQQSGEAYTVDYHYDDLLGIFRSYLTEKLSDADFDVTASLSGGRIVFTANLYERRGSDKSNYALIQGRNCEVTKFDEQGPIVNVWDMPGAGNDWGDEREVGHAEDAASIATYGYRQESQVQTGISGEAQLDAMAEAALAGSSQPHNMISLVAYDLAPAAFADYDLGDRLRLIAPQVGFEGLDTTVRVLARAFDPASGECELVVREE